LNVVDQSLVHGLELAQHLRQREPAFPLGRERVEGVDAAVPGKVSRRPATLQDQGQVGEGLLLPGGHMGQDVAHRPLPLDARLLHLRWRETSVRRLEIDPRLMQLFDGVIPHRER
jgi:hypothetical protein